MIESLKHEVAGSRARLHAQNELERTLRAQLEATRAELDRRYDSDRHQDCSTDTSIDRSLDCATDTSMDRSQDCATDTSCDGPCTTCDAACDPVSCEAEDCQLRLLANEELSTDANELAAEVMAFLTAPSGMVTWLRRH